MYTLYSTNNKLYDWSNSLKDQFKENSIKIGQPLTCEYRRLSIVSNKFDMFGKSEVMLVNYVKHQADKEVALQSITYYDDDARVRKKNGSFRKTHYQEGPFDASEYGHPVCFHTPGYKGSTINITTKFWEVSDNSIIKKVVGLIRSGLNLGSTASPYFTIASAAVGISGFFFASTIKNKELLPNHNLEFRLDSSIHPLLIGKYVCFPDIDLNEKFKIIEEYKLIENMLVKKVDNLYEEYNKSYFVIRVDNDKRLELADFNFTASSADLVNKLNKKASEGMNPMDDLLTIGKEAYNLTLIKEIEDDYHNYKDNPTEENKALLGASYNKIESLGKEELNWFNKNFEEIKNVL